MFVQDDRERADARVDNDSYRYETHHGCFADSRPRVL